MPGTAQVLLASNRGPVSFRPASEEPNAPLSASRGSGGLVSGLTTAARGHDAVWVAAALSDADRRAARDAPNGCVDRAGYDTGGIAVRMLEIDPVVFDRAYNQVANRTLWFICHLLYATPLSPSFDHRFGREWHAYELYNEQFARALAEQAAEGAKVLVQDYHLLLAPQMLRELRPDLRIGHFTHTPWATPDYFSLLPARVARQVLRGLLGADRVAFHTRRWADAFGACCEAMCGATYDGTRVTHEHGVTEVGVHPLGVDGDELRARAAQPDVEQRRAVLDQWLGGRRLILRIDRTELSKNIVRGIAAYRELLRGHPELHGDVMHLVFAYPSRHDLPEYREYTGTVQRAAADVNDEFATEHWTPLVLAVDDDYPRSLAAMTRADVLVTNPVRDGMNLVAKEGPILSRDGLGLVLSRDAGAVDELGDAAYLVNPFDVTETAAAMHAALSASPDERRRLTERLAAAASAAPPQLWLSEQLDALGAS